MHPCSSELPSSFAVSNAVAVTDYAVDAMTGDEDIDRLDIVQRQCRRQRMPASTLFCSATVIRIADARDGVFPGLPQARERAFPDRAEAEGLNCGYL